MPITEDFLIYEDTETTGLVPGQDEVCEIASLLMDLNGHEISRFHQKIQFEHSKMKPEAQAKNGYDPKVWAYEARPFYEYQAWLEKHIPFGHVAIAIGQNPYFDRGILNDRYFKPYGKFFKWSYHCIDVAGLALAMKLAGVIDVPNVKLATVAEALKLPIQPSHRAWDDLMAVKGIFEFAMGVFAA